jgi:hypothetical protein
MAATRRDLARHSASGAAGDAGTRRWVCACQRPAVLLATYDRDGQIHIKVRDRYWHVIGLVEATCPRCGAVHLLSSSNAATANPAS